MDHYIIKIYRNQPQTTPIQIVGTVENMANQQRSAFHNADELLAILGTAPAQSARTKSSSHRCKTDVEPNE